MILSVANPIYDSVFKFLMEDERIAKTVLAALLKKEVLSVKMRRHEHTNTTRDDISMFRIDFSAEVRDANGKQELILIELQKTWLETETLRFRQYLAAQYNAKENMQERTADGKTYATPMIAVYLLGHRVGKITEPVVYVSHNAEDYDGKEVVEGREDPFVNSLIHDSIIVQIPLLHGKINNRLDKVLSVFDQNKRDAKNRQVINLEENAYEGDTEMMYILHRLSAAAVNADLRQEMNVEDEYFSAIEDRDTAIMNRDKMIAERDAKLAEQESKLAEKDSKLAEKDSKLTEQESKLAEQESKLTEQESKLTERDSQLRVMIQSLIDNGASVSKVAKIAGMKESDIKALLE